MGKKGAGKQPREELWLAVDEDDGAAVCALLDADPSKLEKANADGWTPLIAASYAGSAEVVGALLRRGANVAAVCRDGDSAVHYASAQGHADVIRALAARGAKLEATDNDGETPCDVAQSKKIRTLLEALIKEAEKDGGGEKEEGGGGEEDDGDGEDGSA